MVWGQRDSFGANGNQFACHLIEDNTVRCVFGLSGALSTSCSDIKNIKCHNKMFQLGAIGAIHNSIMLALH